MFNGLISAIRFLTVIPLPFRKDAPFAPQAAVPFFPVAGLGVGLILALLDWLFGWCFNQMPAAALDVAVLIGLTGALHIDGLADSGDGLFSHKPALKALEIMRDSRVGAMGMATVAVVLLVKFAALTSIGPHRFLLLLLVPALARTGLVFAMLRLPYLRKEDGLAGAFFVSSPPWLFMVILALILAALLFTGLTGILIIAGYVISTALILLFYRKRMGGVTGDMLGAMIEVQETLLLLLAAVNTGVILW